MVHREWVVARAELGKALALVLASSLDTLSKLERLLRVTDLINVRLLVA